uniref:Uncharacterized protein n=1 Tax=Cyclophora tenuis TaxID=216820 RepID=A0A7S1D3B0_CYCTE
MGNKVLRSAALGEREPSLNRDAVSFVGLNHFLLLSFLLPCRVVRIVPWLIILVGSGIAVDFSQQSHDSKLDTIRIATAKLFHKIRKSLLKPQAQDQLLTSNELHVERFCPHQKCILCS